MSADLACAGPAFVDLTLEGLDAVPQPGEETYARDLVRTPGGAAITARGAARLGLDTVLVAPIGDDPEGAFLREQLARGGIRWEGRRAARTPVTIVMPSDGDRAMATYDPLEATTAAELAAVGADAVVLGLPQLAIAPAGARLYVSVGHAEARAGALPDGLDRATALLLNDGEAELLTGEADPGAAALRLAERAPCAVVTRGSAGAVAASGGALESVPGVPVDVVDTTGAGDLFVAAYAWADARGLALAERLRWAVLYAALSVGVVSGWAGAASLEELVRAASDQGLPDAATMSSTRRKP